LSDISSPVHAFRQIAWLIAKWFLFTVVGLIVLCALVGGVIWTYGWFTHDRHVANINFIVTTSRDQCSDDKYPIYVLIGNLSSKKLEKATFSLRARVKGRSTNIAQYHSYSDDHISVYKEGFANCWAVPPLSEPVSDPRALEWDILSKTLVFGD